MNRPLSRLALAATAATAAAAAQAEPATYMLDPTHTFVMFEIGHFGTSTNRGRFDKKQGSVQLDRAARTGKLEVTIDTASLNTGTEAFTRHLQSKDFLDVATYPNAKFVADQFTYSGDKVSEIAGQFTLLGKTLPLTLKAVNFNCYQNPMLKREVCGGDFETTMQRSLWGVNWGLNMGMPDQVRLVIQVEGVRQ